MNLADVMDDLAARIDTIAGLRVHAFPPDNVHPPAAVVTYPETYTYDETFGRGMDRVTVPVVVMVGKVSDRASRDQLGAYVDGSGVKSLKQIVEYVPGVSRLQVPGGAGAYASTPRTPNLDLTDGVVVELDVTLAGVPPADHIHAATRWIDTAPQQGWIVYLRADGKLGAAWRDSVAATNNFPSGAAGSLEAGRRTYKVDINATTGLTSFFRATTWGGAYTAVGTESHAAGALAVPATTVPLALGKQGDGNPATFTVFDLHHARVSTRAGTVLAEVDLTDHVDGTTSFVDDTARTWTINGTATIEGDTVAMYTAFDSVRVTGAEFDIVSVAGVEHVAATLSLDIAGQGA